jgi:hypothetical protein
MTRSSLISRAVYDNSDVPWWVAWIVIPGLMLFLAFGVCGFVVVVLG